MRNYCPSHCRSIDATNHPKHTEPAQVFTSFLPSKDFRKIGEYCRHSSTYPKRRSRSWIKWESNIWILNMPIAAIIEDPNYKQHFFKRTFSQIASSIGELSRNLLPAWIQFLWNISLKTLCTISCIQCFKGILNVPAVGTETRTNRDRHRFKNLEIMAVYCQVSKLIAFNWKS